MCEAAFYRDISHRASRRANMGRYCFVTHCVPIATSARNRYLATLILAAAETTTTAECHWRPCEAYLS